MTIKFAFEINMGGRSIPLKYDFETIGDHTIFSVFIEDTELKTLVGEHFHFVCPVDRFDPIKYASYQYPEDESLIKQTIMDAMIKKFKRLMESVDSHSNS